MYIRDILSLRVPRLLRMSGKRYILLDGGGKLVLDPPTYYVGCIGLYATTKTYTLRLTHTIPNGS